MKKLYRKGSVHPTPPAVSDHLLSFLPAVILSLTVALSPEEKEVLAYLVSCSSYNLSHNHRKTSQKKTASAAKSGADHPPCFSCNCFRCYMSYWVKWDSSPNRELIHEIIDAFEDSFMKESGKKEKGKKQRRKGKSVKENTGLVSSVSKNSEPSLTREDSSFAQSNSAQVASGGELDDLDVEELEKGSVRRLVSFLGERIWSVWG